MKSEGGGFWWKKDKKGGWQYRGLPIEGGGDQTFCTPSRKGLLADTKKLKSWKENSPTRC